jgi:3-hydroxymyristoyl/3-hydroxydecanoyl-(acyl carrier protein) dehydratase/acyl carrier protein
VSPDALDRQPYGIVPDDAVMLAHIREFVADAADCPVADVADDDDIYGKLGVDSLGAIAIFVDLAYHFHVAEPRLEAEFRALNTPRAMLAYVRTGTVPVTALLDLAPLDGASALALLPIGDEFRFVETIVAYDHGTITTEKTWTADHPILRAHFVSGPAIVPGTLLGEQFAQSALLLGLRERMIEPKTPLLLSRLRCDFIAAARPPVAIRCTVKFRAQVRGQYGFVGHCLADDREVARLSGLAVARASP